MDSAECPQNRTRRRFSGSIVIVYSFIKSIDKFLRYHDYRQRHTRRDAHTIRNLTSFNFIGRDNNTISLDLSMLPTVAASRLYYDFTHKGIIFHYII